MNRLLLIFIAALFSISCYSQISYEKGYFIDNNDQEIDCFIKNIDWRRNPTEFEYKLSEGAESKKEGIETVKEFGIDNYSRYVRAKVNIDRSSDNTNKLSDNKNPIFNEEELFLKVLVEGKSNLFEYIDGNVRRFFYSINNDNIKQLIYKRYLTHDKRIGKNNTFRQQLINDLKCSNLTLTKINNLDYGKGELVKFFSHYNECHNSDYINYTKVQNKDFFNISIRPGLNVSIRASHIFEDRILS